MKCDNASGDSLVKHFGNKHVMIMYEKNDVRNNAARIWINHGLECGQLCIYASVHAFDQGNSLSIASLSSKIIKYQESIDKNELQVVNFKPYYESALKGDLRPFEQLKLELEEKLRQRIAEGKGDKIMVFADAACCLSENRYFKESEILEEWWHNTHNEWVRNGEHIFVICPHPKNTLNNKLDAKTNIALAHDLVIDYELGSHIMDWKQGNRIRILIAEPEPDLRSLYLEYLGTTGAEVVVTENGNECLSSYIEKDYDIVILDTHLRDRTAFDIARKIRSFRPFQRIALTTTNSLDQIIPTVQHIGIGTEDILLKPFMLSTLHSLIKKPSTIKN